MKKHIISYSFIFILLLPIACTKNETPVKLAQVHLTNTQKAVLSSSNAFGLNLFKELGTSLTENENLFISPLSVSLALTMTYNGAAGNTATEMQQVLGYQQQSSSEINQASKDLINLFIALDPKVTMEIANSIWYRNTFQVKADFLNLNKDYFNAQVTAADFNNPETVNIINSWVKNKTHEKISAILENIDPTTVMYLINAIYFKGSWQYMFDKSKTTAQPFYLTNGSSFSTDFMMQECSLKYMSTDLCSAVELPYGNGYFSMVVVLPAATTSATAVLNNLTNEQWTNWNSALTMKPKVQVIVPKFTTKSDLQLNDNLTHLGMKDAFNKDNADFSRIDGAKDLYISKVKHKSFVEVNEEGTEAAAVTSVEIIVTTAGPGYDDVIHFNANKPFLFFIKENTTNSILFSGIIQKPSVN